MQIEIYYQGFKIKAKVSPEEPQTFHHPGYPESLYDIDSGLMSSEMYEAFEDDIVEDLWYAVEKKKEFEGII